jgi:hypothetical protein
MSSSLGTSALTEVPPASTAHTIYQNNGNKSSCACSRRHFFHILNSDQNFIFPTFCAAVWASKSSNRLTVCNTAQITYGSAIMHKWGIWHIVSYLFILQWGGGNTNAANVRTLNNWVLLEQYPSFLTEHSDSIHLLTGNSKNVCKIMTQFLMLHDDVWLPAYHRTAALTEMKAFAHRKFYFRNLYVLKVQYGMIPHIALPVNLRTLRIG